MTQEVNKNIKRPYVGFALLGKESRSPEFTAARNTLVDRVNGFLEGLASRRDAPDNTAGGLALRSTGVITETDLGPSRMGMRMIGTGYARGMRLTGDGVQTPLELQMVVPIKSTEGDGDVTVITVRGSDPLSRIVYGPRAYDLSRRSEVVAAFDITSLRGGIQDQSGYSVTGDGDFRHEFIDDRGVHASEPVRDVEAADEAQRGLDRIIELVEGSLAS